MVLGSAQAPSRGVESVAQVAARTRHRNARTLAAQDNAPAKHVFSPREEVCVSETTCPLCGRRVDADVRHPRRVCETCVGRARDEEGRPLRFFNTGFSGGFVARLADGGMERESHECVIDGVRCWADEAYLGGIVVEVAAEGRRSAPGPGSIRPAHVGPPQAGASGRMAAGDRQAGAARPEAGTAARAETRDRLASIRGAEEKAWWKDLTGLVGPTDRQLAVISPRSGATADELRGLGQVLARWKAEYTQARHIWGLTELLDGRPPRTPPVYLAVPVFIARFEERYEPVALVYVAEGGDLTSAATDLYDRLDGFRNRLAWVGSPDEYCDQRR